MVDSNPLSVPAPAHASTDTVTFAPAHRPTAPGRTMMTILNGGRMSRHWLMGLGNAAVAMGLRHVFIEIDAIRQAVAADSKGAVAQLNQVLAAQKIGLVLNYGLNAAFELPVDKEWPGTYRNFFEVRGIPQCFLWADHPQWVADKAALAPNLQPVFRSGNQFHFLKSGAHAHELNRILGWPNCHELACAADPNALKPAVGVTPRFDVIAIYSGEQTLADWLVPFLSQDDPNPDEINAVVAKEAAAELTALWQKESSQAMWAELEAWSRRAIALKLANPSQALARHLNVLTDEFPMTTWWMTAMFPVYFKAAAILYKFRSWQRHFYLAYLSKYFRVGLFGGKWSHVGTGAEGTGQWVDFLQFPQTLAQGKVALDIVAGWDEEGLTAKTFELAACGTAMVHNDCVGLPEAFEAGREIEVFVTPRQAREAVQRLLDDENRRKAMGEACRARLLAQHTWGHRVKRMFELSGVPIDMFH
jgi:hypothetical protein